MVWYVSECKNVYAFGEVMFEAERRSHSNPGRGDKASYQTIQPWISAHSAFGRGWFFAAFRYLPSRVGREGEKCRSRDHMRLSCQQRSSALVNST